MKTLLVPILVLPTLAVAQEVSTIYENGAWSVQLESNNGAPVACSAYVFSAQEDTFYLVKSAEDQSILFGLVDLKIWRGRAPQYESVFFSAAIGSETWELAFNINEGNGDLRLLNSGDNLSDLLARLYAGEWEEDATLDIYGEFDSREIVASFPLQGYGDAMLAARGCATDLAEATGYTAPPVGDLDILESGAWTAVATYDAESAFQGCGLRATNDKGQGFFFDRNLAMDVIIGAGETAGFVDPTWQLRYAQGVPLYVNIGNRSWSLLGLTTGSMLAVDMRNEGGNWRKLYDALQSGILPEDADLVVTNERGEERARFSMEGHAEAVAAMGRCYAGTVGEEF